MLLLPSNTYPHLWGPFRVQLETRMDSRAGWEMTLRLTLRMSQNKERCLIEVNLLIFPWSDYIPKVWKKRQVGRVSLAAWLDWYGTMNLYNGKTYQVISRAYGQIHAWKKGIQGWGRREQLLQQLAGIRWPVHSHPFHYCPLLYWTFSLWHLYSKGSFLCVDQSVSTQESPPFRFQL